MIWIGILLCLAFTSSQGQPLGDASDAKELREADDQTPKVFELVVGKEKGEQMYQFPIKDKIGVLVQTENALNWKEARARCQQLNNELGWTDVGDLGHFLDPKFDNKYLDSGKSWDLKHALYEINRKWEQGNTESRIKNVWLGEDSGEDNAEENCMYFYYYGNYVTAGSSCDKKLQAFLCEFSSVNSASGSFE